MRLGANIVSLAVDPFCNYFDRPSWQWCQYGGTSLRYCVIIILPNIFLLNVGIICPVALFLFYFYYYYHHHLLYPGYLYLFPETNYVHREYSVAAVLLLPFMVLISLVSLLNLLYFYISTFRSMCAVPNMAVFWSSLTSYFPGMLLTYFLNDFEIVPVAPFITGVACVFTFHMRCISVVRSLYFRIFSASFLITFLSREIARTINIHVPFSLSRIIMSGLLLGILLSVCIVLVDSTICLPCLLDLFLLILAHIHTSVFFLSNCTPVSLHMLKCSCTHTLSCLFM